MSTQTLMQELMEWLGALSPEFAFLLVLPFAVAAAALAAEWVRHRRSRRQSRRTPTKRPGRHGHRVPS
jgi:hypothetical protein